MTSDNRHSLPTGQREPCPRCGTVPTGVTARVEEDDGPSLLGYRPGAPLVMNLEPCGHRIYSYLIDTGGRASNFRMEPIPEEPIDPGPPSDFPGALPAGYQWNHAGYMHWWPSGPTPERGHP